MNEQIRNINPWAQNLDQISLPSADESWRKMGKLLDQHLPEKQRNRNRFFFWIILLTALAVLFFFMDQIYLKESHPKENMISSAKPTKTKNQNNSNGDSSPVDSGYATVNNKSKTKDISQPYKATGDQKNALAKNKSEFKKAIAKPYEAANEYGNDPKSNSKSYENENAKNSQGLLADHKEGSGGSADLRDKKHFKRKLPGELEGKRATLHDKRDSPPISNQKNKNRRYWKDGINKTRLLQTAAANRIFKQLVGDVNSDIMKEALAKEESIDKNDNFSDPKKIVISFITVRASKIKSADILDEKKTLINRSPENLNDNPNKIHHGVALVAGIGLNQFIPVGGQRYSGLNANGSNNVLTDYAPVPMLNLYFNKKLFVRLEAEINTPQYTRALTVLDKRTNVVNGYQTFTNQDSSILNTLFYFNLPLSIHYSLLKNLFVGAGLQFSMLTNGAGTFASKADSSLNGYNTYIYTSFQKGSLKNTPVYKELKRDEWRFLFDVDYQWKNFVFGVRYSQAVSNFISEPVQEKNSAALIYIRYLIWKNKNAKQLITK